MWSPFPIREFAVMGVTFPALLLLVYSLTFAPYWVRYQGGSYGPVYGRQPDVRGVVQNVPLDEYHMSVYRSMAAAFIACLAVLCAATAQFGYSFLPCVCCRRGGTRARRIIVMTLAACIAVWHFIVLVAAGSIKHAPVEWAYYLVAVLGTPVAAANLALAIMVHRGAV